MKYIKIKVYLTSFTVFFLEILKKKKKKKKKALILELFNFFIFSSPDPKSEKKFP